MPYSFIHRPNLLSPVNTKQILLQFSILFSFLRHICDTTTATLYPDNPVGLPSEHVGLSLSGYESFEPRIGLGGLVPTPRTNHQYHLAPPIFRVVVIWFFPVVSFSNRASVGSLFNCSVPPLPFHRSPSPSLCYIVPWFFEPSWPGTGPFQPSIRPFHRLSLIHI